MRGHPFRQGNCRAAPKAVLTRITWEDFCHLRELECLVKAGAPDGNRTGVPWTEAPPEFLCADRATGPPVECSLILYGADAGIRQAVSTLK
jgi:hypothetical protein